MNISTTYLKGQLRDIFQGKRLTKEVREANAIYLELKELVIIPEKELLFFIAHSYILHSNFDLARRLHFVLGFCYAENKVVEAIKNNSSIGESEIVIKYHEDEGIPKEMKSHFGNLGIKAFETYYALYKLKQVEELNIPSSTNSLKYKN